MQQEAYTSGERLLRLPDVEARTGLKKSAIYAGMKNQTFPQCVKLGARAAAWSLSSIELWIAEKIRGGKGKDSLESQCARAAEYMATHSACTLRELATGADLGNASKEALALIVEKIRGSSKSQS